MATFRTEFEIATADFTISHKDKLFLLGSCFSTEIGQKLMQAAFQCAINPTGIVFNPASMAATLELCLHPESWDSDRMVQRNDVWLSWDHQGHFHNTDKGEFSALIVQDLAIANQSLLQSKVFILTLGSAFTYVEKQTAQVVSNCHRFPAADFDKRFLNPQECVKYLAKPIAELLTMNPDLKIILTISPVRHTRDGMVENQRSKASLVLACQQLQSQFPGISYFPAYELMLDDLRDYRFYGADMIHPSVSAVEYIWQHFCATYFSDQTVLLIEKIMQFRTELAHRPLQSDTKENQERIQKLRMRIEAFEKESDLKIEV